MNKSFKNTNSVNSPYLIAFTMIVLLYRTQSFRDYLHEGNSVEVKIDENDASYSFKENQLNIYRKKVDVNGKPIVGENNSDYRTFQFTDQVAAHLEGKGNMLGLPISFDANDDTLLGYIETFEHYLHTGDSFSDLMELRKDQVIDVLSYLTKDQAEMFIDAHLKVLLNTHH